MGNKKGVPRLKKRKGYAEPLKIVWHPEYKKTMVFRSGWLRLPKKNEDLREAIVVEYRDNMREAGINVDTAKEKSICERCGKEKSVSKMMKAVINNEESMLCFVCYRVNEKPIEKELADLRHHFKYGANIMQTNFNFNGV